MQNLLPHEDAAAARLKGPVLRLIACAGLLVSEYLVLAILYDGQQLAEVAGRWPELQNATNAVAIGSAVVTAGFITRGNRFLDALRDSVSVTRPVHLRALTAHGTSFALFFALTEGIFARKLLESSRPSWWAAAWALTGVANLVTLFWLAAGDAWRRFARASLPALASGAVTGGLAWYFAWKLRPAWPWLVAQTLPLAGNLLRALVGPERVHTNGAILGVDRFRVEVAPECSGVEGLVVITFLLVGYLLMNRERLRFPNALLMLPLAAAATFTMNVVRVATLVMIGAWISPAIAFGGFHSKAGWLSVCCIALAAWWMGERFSFLARAQLSPPRTQNAALPYCMPLFVSTGLGMLTGLVAAASVDWLYALHILGAAAVAYRYRHAFELLGRPFSFWPLLNGALVFGLWFWLADRGSASQTGEMLSELFVAPEPLRVAWCASRVIGSVFVVPVSEELAFRGFLQRRFIAADFTHVSFRRFTWVSWLGSAAAFGAVHQSVLAGAIAGVAYSAAGHQRGKLADAILAHATTNALIAVAVLAFDQWWLW